jgi:parallel beta-helix repeat protein
VNGYTISNLYVNDADTYNLCLFTTENGTVSGNDISADIVASTDGVSIQNSQDITVTENTISNGDDGIYVWSSYNDPRGGSWWNTASPQASTNIPISHNTLTHSAAHGLAIIPWGMGAPNVSDTVISDVSFIDNSTSDEYGFGMWGEDPYYNGADSFGPVVLPETYADDSPVQDVTFSGNNYNGDPVTSIPQTITNLQASDWPTPSASNEWSGDSPTVFMNGGFEDHGMAYWDSVGPASDVGAAEYSVGQDGSWYGYMQYFSTSYEALYQGLTLNSGDSYTFRLRTESSGKPFRMFVYDTCNGATITGTTFSNTSWGTQTLSFSVPSGDGCTDYHVGVDNAVAGHTYGASDWVRIDDSSLSETSGSGGEPAVVLAGNPENSYSSGGWNVGAYSGDIDGADSYSCTSGASVTVPFFGSGATVIAVTGPTLGNAEVYVDGAYKSTVDLYSASNAFQQDVFSTGSLAYGRHLVELVVDGSTCVDLNAVQPS